MPSIAAVATIDLPNKTTQQEVKEQAHRMFSQNFPQTDRLIFAFDKPEIFVSRYHTIPGTPLLNSAITII